MTALLTPAELAAHLRVSERTVARMVLDGCPSLLVGSRRRFELPVVLAWATARAEGADAAAAMAQASASAAANAFTDQSRRAHIRVLPGASRMKNRAGR
jgi:hypothetical protein